MAGGGGAAEKGTSREGGLLVSAVVTLMSEWLMRRLPARTTR